MNKYLKIFVVSLCLVALFTVSCFATSSGIESADVYGHYISPGDYVFAEELDFYRTNFIFAFPFKVKETPFTANFDRIKFAHDGSNFGYYISNGTDGFTAYDFTNSSWRNDNYRYFTVTQGFYIYDFEFFNWWVSNVTALDLSYDRSFLDALVSLFTAVGTWISESVIHVSSMFWDGSALTFLGTLAVAGLAFSVAFLLVSLISNFLRFRG